LMTANYQ